MSKKWCTAWGLYHEETTAGCGQWFDMSGNKIDLSGHTNQLLMENRKLTAALADAQSEIDDYKNMATPDCQVLIADNEQLELRVKNLQADNDLLMKRHQDAVAEIERLKKLADDRHEEILKEIERRGHVESKLVELKEVSRDLLEKLRIGHDPENEMYKLRKLVEGVEENI